MISRRGFAAAAAGAPLGALAAEPPAGRIQADRLTSPNVPGAVPVSVYLPAGYGQAPARRYPLLLLLHGGDGSEQDLARFAPLIDAAIDANRLPPLVVATPGARRSLYMDYRDGSERWETFVVSDLLAHLRRSFSVSAERRDTLIGGWSMGGLGSLRMAFKHPEVFGAVAAVEPAIEPALTWGEIGPRVKFWRSDDIYQTMFGKPVDEGYWRANNPASIAQRDPDRLLGLGIYLDVGDQDMLYLSEGVEFLHRILFDAAVGHEYRLVRGAEHVGPSLQPRMLDALGFIGRQLDPPPWIDRSVEEVRAVMDRKKRANGLPVGAPDRRRIRNR